MSEKFHSGFIAIIGRSNVGKSTLMNRLIGEKVAIISNRPQTTRNRIQGVLTRPEYQMVFIDTPGIHKPKNKLSQYMVNEVNQALDEVEAILLVVDGEGGIGHGDQTIIDELKKARAPRIMAVNKIDIISRERLAQTLAELSEVQDDFDAIIPISALEGDGVEDLERILARHLVPGPKYFPDDMITDQPERLLIAELIREKALELLEEEVPHGVGVEITGIHLRDDKKIMDVQATLYCEKETHKGIIIGKRGQMLKEIGQRARVEIEALLGSKIYLELWVKVKDDWRNSMATLRTLGYE